MKNPINYYGEYNMIKKFFFSNRESCPCGSGELFKDCCKMKPPKTFRSQGEMLNFIGKIMKKSRVKICLYNACTAKPKSVINAHALQENRILNKLAVNKHIMMQDMTKKPIILEIKKGHPEPFHFLSDVHIKNATTATCFCGTHDDSVFGKIEKTKYTLDVLDEEQIFLFAYKTFAFELYNVIATLKYQKNMFSSVPQTTREISVVHSYRNNILKLDDFQCYRDFFDTAISVKDYSGLMSVVLNIPDEIKFANYMTVAPPFDLRGRKIKSVHKKTQRMKFVFFTIFPVENKSYILISALKDDKDVYGEYLEQIKNSPLGLVQFYLNAFIPLYSQNLIISPSLWNSWNKKGQMGIQYAVGDMRNTAILKGLQFGLRNIDKKQLDLDANKINSSQIAFDFFKI